MLEPISYKIHLDKLKQHLLRVECTIQNPDFDGQIISLANWIPGSYAIRDLAKNIVSINAIAENAAVPMHKINKNTWQCAPCSGPLVISYLVYCFDAAARGAYVDHTRVFFDGCRVFLVVEGEEEQSRSVEIVPPTGTEFASWRVATSMPAVQIDAKGFGKYSANNQLDLIDHPFEIGAIEIFEFVVAEVPHKIVVSGKASADYMRLVSDVQQICTAQVNFFGELPAMQQYVFILSIQAKGGGGIEHRSSSSLICNRSSLPKVGDEDIKSDEYKALLGLFSHEYFHLWNVKRIKPEVFINPNLNAEVYTRQLWIFEGITAYFDNLLLVHAGVLKPSEYIRIIEDDINQLLQTPGAKRQSLEESSFDAWIKYYQPDENSINASVSYYLKGCLVALALDLSIIHNSKRKQSLADIMQVLWQQYGKTGLGLPERHFEHITFEVTGEDYTTFFAQNLRSTAPLELADLLQTVGVNYRAKAATVIDNLGLKLAAEQTRIIVKAVLSDSVAESAGIAANDIIVAINSLAVTMNNIEASIASCTQNEDLTVHIFRNDVLLELQMFNPPLLQSMCSLDTSASLSADQELSRNKWLGLG